MIRLVFKLCVILCLIFIGLSYFMPRQPPQPGESASESASSAGILAGIAAFGAFITDIDGFCARNPQSCETGKSLFGTLADRAGQGAAVAYQWFGANMHKGAENTEQHLHTAEAASAAPQAAEAKADSAPIIAGKQPQTSKAAAAPEALKTAAKAEAGPAAARPAKPKPAPAAHRPAKTAKAVKKPPVPQAAPKIKSKVSRPEPKPASHPAPRHKAKAAAEQN